MLCLPGVNYGCVEQRVDRKLDKLAAQWKPKLEKKHKKRHFIRRLMTAEDDRELVILFANAVEQTIHDFLVST